MQSRHAQRMHAALHAFDDDNGGGGSNGEAPAELDYMDVVRQPMGSAWVAPRADTPATRAPEHRSSQPALAAQSLAGPASAGAPGSHGSSSNSQLIYPGDSVSQQQPQGVAVRRCTWLAPAYVRRAVRPKFCDGRASRPHT